MNILNDQYHRRGHQARIHYLHKHDSIQSTCPSPYHRHLPQPHPSSVRVLDLAHVDQQGPRVLIVSMNPPASFAEID
jgi:hypothetical protein